MNHNEPDIKNKNMVLDEKLYPVWLLCKRKDYEREKIEETGLENIMEEKRWGLVTMEEKKWKKLDWKRLWKRKGGVWLLWKRKDYEN